jgi:hypothetical protein
MKLPFIDQLIIYFYFTDVVAECATQLVLPARPWLILVSDVLM